MDNFCILSQVQNICLFLPKRQAIDKFTFHCCIEILSVEDEALAQKLTEARVKAAQKVLEKNKAVEEKYNN